MLKQINVTAIHSGMVGTAKRVVKGLCVTHHLSKNSPVTREISQNLVMTRDQPCLRTMIRDSGRNIRENQNPLDPFIKKKPELMNIRQY